MKMVILMSMMEVMSKIKGELNLMAPVLLDRKMKQGLGLSTLMGH